MINEKIRQLETFKEVVRLTTNMYRLGWDERNGGNVSVIFEDEEVEVLKDLPVIREYNLGYDASYIKGKYFLVTGTGKYFKNVEYRPEINLGIVRISEKGDVAELLWGFEDGKGPTSELPTHLMNHIARLKIDPLHRVVIHTHATHTICLSYLLPEDEDVITKTLWRMSTECIVVFPEGIGYLPWMVCGGNEIGVATSEKMKQYRVVIWGMHGVFGTGRDIDEAFGLIETVEKAAQIYCICKNDIKQSITDDQLKDLAKAFKIEYKKII